MHRAIGHAAQKKPMLIILATTLVLSMAPISGAGMPDRHAVYAGPSVTDSEVWEECAQWVEDCLIFGGPDDRVLSVCDQSDGIAGSGIHGLGEVRFCGVATGSLIKVTAHDDVLAARILVTCPVMLEPTQPLVPSWPFTQTTWYQELGRGNSFTGEVPAHCLDTRGEGTTDLRVFVLEGVAGTLVLSDTGP